jgi:hypothetical protein
LAYAIGNKAIVTDLSKLAAPAKATWLDPTNGSQSAIDRSPFANSGTHEFVAPDKNAAGDSDWVLVLEAKK